MGKTIGVIQARVGSERFPGKVMQPLPVDSDVPMIMRIVQNAERIPEIDQVIVATTIDESDQPLVEFCERNRISVFRGSVENVLSRYINAAESLNADTVIRLTGDNPMLDADAMSACIQYHRAEGNDYTNTKGLPVGMNCEVISANALLSLSKQMHKLGREEKEHVTLRFLNDRRFTTSTMKVELPKALAAIRLTVDYVSDYLLINALFQLQMKSDKTGAEFIEEVRMARPWLFLVNRDNVQKKQFDNFAEEKEEAVAILNRYDMTRIASFLEKSNEEH